MVNNLKKMKRNEIITGDYISAEGLFKENPEGQHMLTYNPSIEYLAKKYQTDKLDHGYLPYYEKHIGYMWPIEINLLEIGCLKGASLRMWQEYFPKAKISTIDLFRDPNNVTKNQMESEGFIAHAGDQSDISFLYTVKDMFQVIIDDGSHNSDHQQITFKHLFINNLCSEGVYVVEDLHCCKEPYYWGKNISDFKDTILSVLTEYKNTGRLENKYFNEKENEIFVSNISKIEIYDEKIAFIWKK